MINNWTHFGTCVEGESFVIDEIDVWKNKWVRTGATAKVTDPLYGQEYHFDVYSIYADDHHIEFAAGEFSNAVWGFYTKGHQ